jgi:alkylhydroperoxidase family enzyme
VRSHLDERQTVDVMVTIGAYNMVSRFLVALEMGH